MPQRRAKLEHGRRRGARGDRLQQHHRAVDRLDALHAIGGRTRHFGGARHWA